MLSVVGLRSPRASSLTLLLPAALHSFRSLNSSPGLGPDLSWLPEAHFQDFVFMAGEGRQDSKVKSPKGKRVIEQIIPLKLSQEKNQTQR